MMTKTKQVIVIGSLLLVALVFSSSAGFAQEGSLLTIVPDSLVLSDAPAAKVNQENGLLPAAPSSSGSGRVDPDLLKDPEGAPFSPATNHTALQNELGHVDCPDLTTPDIPGRITVHCTFYSELNRKANWKTSVKSPSDLTVIIPKKIKVPAYGEAIFDLTLDARFVPLGEARHAMLVLTHKDKSVSYHISIVRVQPAVTLEKVCAPGASTLKKTADCTITITNTAFEEAKVSLVDNLPKELKLVTGTVVGANQDRKRKLSYEGSLAGAGPAEIAVKPGMLFGYFSLKLLGFPPAPCPSDCDEGGLFIDGLDVYYLGQHYTDGIWSVNGTLELGKASGAASPSVNQNLPDPAAPNNVLSPWWTDLNLGAGGNWYKAGFTDGVRTWNVLEWNNVPRSGDLNSRFSFQIWLERGTDHITFTYGPLRGKTMDGTTGAENEAGTAGDTTYYDGSGTLPWGGSDLTVTAVPGKPGETHTVTFTARMKEDFGQWSNCAEMTSDLFQGVNIACFSGEVMP